MKKIKFLFGIHNHQPVGNFGHVFEEIHEKCYRPYLEVLAKFPGLKTAIHFSGPLLEWLKDHRPGTLKIVKDLAAAGRLEIMSGGFYEPLLSTLPEEDAVGQIRMMNNFIRDEFDYSPKGLWLAERIWTPNLPSIIAAAGIQYTVVDDTHFYYSGMEEHQLQGYFITERLGRPLFVFPISKALRYAIPFKLPGETLDILRRAKEEFRFQGVTYADDGEKFGSWPETHHWVYTEKWLEKFFTALDQNADWIETVTFREYIDRYPPTGRIYLPMASYDEMMEWSLPTSAAWKFADLKKELQDRGIPEERYKLFLRAGQWDNFLTKYEESNLLHKKMLHVSRKVNQLPKEERESTGALRELYRGQCNCAQWHGLFGGLYLNYLRHALYQHLIAAENIADSRQGPSAAMETLDYNLDGRAEVLVHNPEMSALLAPAYGGALVELDYRPACFNLSNVLRRREETYHKTILEAAQSESTGPDQPRSIHDRIQFKEAELQNQLFFDRWERYSFMDHFLGPETRLDSFRQCRFEEQGEFVDQLHAMKPSAPDRPEGDFVLECQRTGSVVQQQVPHPVTLEKSFSFSRDEARILCRYRITNAGEESVGLWWGVEFNFTLLAGDAPDRYYVCPGRDLEFPRLISEGELNDVESFGMRDGWQGFQLTLDFSPKVTVWRFPVETVSQSESGFERTYQGSCILAHRQFELSAGQSREQTILLTISR